MNVEDFIAENIKNHLLAKRNKNTCIETVKINEIVAICIKEYRQRSSFKPDVMTYLFKKADKLYQK